MVVFVGVFAGLIYTTEGSWWPLVIVMPTGLLGIVLLKVVMFESEVGASVQTDGDEPMD